jgi:hypothetical protein
MNSTQCSILVRAKLTNGLLDRSIHGALVEDLKELLSSFRESSVSAVRRSVNGAAHILAKEMAGSSTG